MASTPLEQDRPAPSRIQRVIMAATRKPRASQSAPGSAREGAVPSAADAPALPLARASLRIEDGVLMAFGPEGDPIPPAAFAAAAARQPEVSLAWSGGRTVSSKRVAAVLAAQVRGPLGPAQGKRSDGEPWIRAMLGLGPQPEPASEDELRSEPRACELTVFRHELMITLPSGRSFLVAEAAPAHHAAAASLTLQDGRAVSVGHLAERLRAHGEQSRRAGGAPHAPSGSELPLPDCGVQSAGGALLLQLPAVGVVRLAQPAGTLDGPRVSIFLASGEPAGVADVIAELGQASDPSRPVPGKPDPGKPDPAKPEAAKPEASKPEASNPEAAKAEAAKPEAAEPEGAKPEAGKPEPAKPHAAETEDAKPEAGRLEAGQPEAGQPEAGLGGGAPSSRTGPSPALPASEKQKGAAEGASAAMVPMRPPVPLAIRPPGPAGVDAERIALVMIGNLPPGAMLSAGSASGDGGWMLSPQDLVGLTLRVPAGPTKALALQVTALAIQDRDSELATAAATVEVSLEPARWRSIRRCCKRPGPGSTRSCSGICRRAPACRPGPTTPPSTVGCCCRGSSRA